MTPEQLSAQDSNGCTLLHIAGDHLLPAILDKVPDTALGIITSSAKCSRACCTPLLYRLHSFAETQFRNHFADDNPQPDGTLLDLVMRMTPHQLARADLFGTTALHLAAHTGHVELLSSLLSRLGQHSCMALDKCRCNALHYAMGLSILPSREQQRSEEVLARLLGALPSSARYHKDSSGCSPHSKGQTSRFSRFFNPQVKGSIA
eukprot:CAMPEP_0114603834 /NCGR_PEP_ID=MMETSP0168-20121206/234_1 /TAXON_ID=95228 ORGANISM="Vannella sp., Strain DIVA3 517/6/12" /NCGR_SAMPLE_ID=MMETSP0168 /ASSEMBLY_ACC=CAM_ASM_000044 /LENGTH=204 /DNA_ID=CAMNT_0001814647 /DNA_START=160 /DNA_END=774 /DNA_ORIENTATION=+